MSIKTKINRISWRVLMKLRKLLSLPGMSYEDVEKSEQAFYNNYLKSGMTVFDIGANIGDITLMFSKLVGPTGTVHSFEATGSTFAQLEENVKLANCANVRVNHLAVADSLGSLQFYIYDQEHSRLNSLADRPLGNYGMAVSPIGVEEVQAITVDSYCEQHKIEFIDLLKVDVEGAEYQVLKGANRMLREKRVRCCTFEFGQTTFDMGNKPEEIRVYLRSCGYRIRNMVKWAPVFPGGADVATATFSVHIASPNL